jgi:hypothetical protein
MNTISLNLEDDVAALLLATNQPLHQAVREFIILELYRRGTLSSGKAAELLENAALGICPLRFSFGHRLLRYDRD